MEAIENAAYVSVGRACGFAGLAIFCLVFGLSFDPPFAARTGGICCLVVTLVLGAYALRAPSRPYKRTETWLILPKDQRPPAEVAQQLIGETLRGAYVWYARQTGAVAIVFFIAALALRYLNVPGFE